MQRASRRAPPAGEALNQTLEESKSCCTYWRFHVSLDNFIVRRNSLPSQDRNRQLSAASGDAFVICATPVAAVQSNKPRGDSPKRPPDLAASSPKNTRSFETGEPSISGERPYDAPVRRNINPFFAGPSHRVVVVEVGSSWLSSAFFCCISNRQTGSGSSRPSRLFDDSPCAPVQRSQHSTTQRPPRREKAKGRNAKTQPASPTAPAQFDRTDRFATVTPCQRQPGRTTPARRSRRHGELSSNITRRTACAAVERHGPPDAEEQQSHEHAEQDGRRKQSVGR